MDSYLKNRYGGALTDEQFEDIPYPSFELTIHVTDRCFQAGCLLSTIIAGGVTAIKGPRNVPSLLNRVRRYGLRGAIIGIALGPVMTYGKIHNMEEEGIKDRCFRLRHNRNQVRVDQAVDAGFVLGALGAYAMKGSLLTGMVLGVNTGILAMAVYNNTGSSKP